VFAQLAFQDPAPMPPPMAPTPLLPAPMDPMLMGDPQPLPAPDGAAGAESGEADRVSEAEQLGEEPESNNLSFLRRQTVLLEPGEWQHDIGFVYSLSEVQSPVALTSAGTVVGVAGVRIRQRLLTCPFEVRVGALPRVQLFMNMPVGWSGTQTSFAGFDESQNLFGVGDLRTGMSVLLKKAEGCSPDVIGTFDMTFPTGNDNFFALGLFPGAQLGEGFYALSASLLCIHTYDPVVIFYGGGYRHRFDDPSMGVDIDPGEQFFYQLGVGFAVNERITLSASFLGAYVTKIRVNDVLLDGSNQEPMRMRFSVTVLNPDRCLPKWRGLCKVKEIVEPFAEIGMTEDSPDGRFGIVWTY
jgi:hypothetical protein